jgi:hypothetical protein
MINWIHKLLNPHCEHCKDEERDEKVCNSCEILKEEVAHLRNENRRLIDSITTKPEVEEIRTQAPVPISPKRTVPWAVRKQMLEQEDRQKARARANAARPDTVEDLEKEMNIVQDEREAAKS